MTSRTILISKTLLAYELKKSKRAKRARITMHSDGKIIVTIPWFRSEHTAERLIKEKSVWVINNIKKVLKKNIVVLPKIKKSEMALVKKKAKDIIEKKVKEVCDFYELDYKKIFIKDHRSQWGSCSSLKNLNFNVRLIFLPEHLIEYVVVHEICHLKEQNHSKSFWKLVEKAVENYKECNKELSNFVIS